MMMMNEAKRHGDARTIGGRDYAVMVRHDRGREPWTSWVAVIDDGDYLMVGSGGYTARTRLQAIALAQRELDERAVDEQMEAARHAEPANDPGWFGVTKRPGNPQERPSEHAGGVDWTDRHVEQAQARAAAERLDDEPRADFRGYEDPGQTEPAVLTADEEAALETAEARWAAERQPFDPRPGEALLAAADEAMRRWGAESIEDACYRYDVSLLLEPTAEERKMRRSDALYEIQYGRTGAEGAAARRGRR